MTRIEEEVMIEASAERIFNYLAEGKNALEWHPAVKSVEHLTLGLIGMGTRTRFVVLVRGRRFEWEAEVVEFDVARAFRDRMISGPFKRYEDWVHLEPAGDKVKCTFGVDYELPGGFIGKLLDYLLLRSQVKSDMKAGLARVKELMEK